MLRQTERAGAREWAGMGLLALPTVLLGLDVTVLYLVLPGIAADLAPSATQTLWIMDAYGFFIAGFLVTMGTLGDRIGRRRLLMIGMLAFAAASVLAACAHNPEMLIAARMLLGVAGATLMPSTLSLIASMFRDRRQRALAIGVWATMFALGMAVGPVVGGLLLDAFWWGAAFLLAVPVAALVLAGAPFLLPEHADPDAGRTDLASVALSLLAILPIVYAIKSVTAYGVTALAGTAVSVGLVAAVMFVRRQRRLEYPLLDVTLFADRGFAAGLSVLLIGLIGVGGSMFLVTQYLQGVVGLSAFAAGLWMGPPALAMFAAAVGAPLLARRFRPGYVMGTALSISLIGYALLAAVSGLVPVTVGFAFVYLGLGAIAALGTDLVISTAPASRSGSAASLSETVQELGLAVGVALLGSVATAVYQTRLSSTSTVADQPSGGFSALHADVVDVPSGALVVLQDAFTVSMQTASVVAGVATLAALVLCVTVLRHVPAFGRGADTADDR